MAASLPPTGNITPEKLEAMDLFIGRYMAGVAASMIGFFVFSVLIYTEVIPRVTTFDKIFWGVFGAFCLLIAAVLIGLLLREDSPCRRRHWTNKRATC